MTRHSHSVPGEVSPDLYHALLDHSLRACSSFLLVVHNPEELEPTAEAVLNRLQPFERRVELEHEWPGTRLPLEGEGAIVHHFRLTADAVAVLHEAATAFGDWQEPELPEDPAFLREDGSVWLGTIAHENDVFLELSAAEKQALLDAVPGLRLRRDDHTVLGVARVRAERLSAEQQRAFDEQYLDPPAEVRIVQFAEDPGFWLLRLDADANRMTESFHARLDGALQKAREELALDPADWRLKDGRDR